MYSHHRRRIWLLVLLILAVSSLILVSLYSISQKGQAIAAEDNIAARYGLEKPLAQEPPLKSLLSGDFGATWNVSNSWSDYTGVLILMLLIGLTIMIFIVHKAAKKGKSKE